MSGDGERHARSKWDWGTGPSRSAIARDAVAGQHPEPVTAKRAPARKDTGTWCKGKPGREHKPGIRLAPLGPRYDLCQWRMSWYRRDKGGYAPVWGCAHREACQVCGKVFRDGWQIGRECPDFPGDDAQKAAVQARCDEANERAASRPSRRPVITGPQGYRRKKPA